jgi:uncharacterized protein (TIGR03437 family)
MLKKVFAGFAACLMMFVPAALQAQNLMVTPGIGSAGQAVNAYTGVPISAINSFIAGPGTFQVIAKPDGIKYYAIANSAAQPVTVISNNFGTSTPLPAYTQAATAAAMTPDGTRLAVADGKVLHIYNTATDTEVVSGGVSVGTSINIFDVAVGLDGKRFFTLGLNTAGGSQLNAIDASSNVVLSTSVAILGNATAISVGPNGFVYVSTVNQILEIDPNTVALTAGGPIPLNAKPGRVVFTPDGKFALAPNLTPNTGSAAVLISIPNHAQVNFVGNFGVVIDNLITAGSGLILGYSSQVRGLYAISIAINSTNLAFNALTLSGVPSNSITAATVSNEVAAGGRSTAQSLFVVANSIVYQTDLASGALLGQAALASGNTGGAMSFTGAAATGTDPALIITYGTNQSVPTSGVTGPLVLQALDGNGRPLSGVAVNFSTNSASATLSASSVTTAANGYAVTYLTAPATNGPVVVTATAGSQSTTYNISVGTGTGGGGGGVAGVLKIVAGQGQMFFEASNSQGQGSSPLIVKLLDANGAPIKDASITYEVVQGGGVVGALGSNGLSATVTTDKDGLAQVDFLAGVIFASPNRFSQTTINVSAPGTNTVTFYESTVSQTFGPTVFLKAPQAGDLLSGPAGSTLPGAVIVQVGSGAGTAIPNVSLTLNNGGLDPLKFPSATCKTTDGSGVVLSDSTGTAVCDVVFGPKTGNGQVFGNVGYFAFTPPFNIQVSVGVPGAVKITQGNNQTGNPNQRLPQALVVQVTDAFGNTLSAVPVTWQVLTQGGATLSNVSSATDANGNASALATLGSVAGNVQVKVTAGSVSATFTLKVNIPTAGIQKVSGDAQTALISTAFGAPLVVKVVDAQGSPVLGAAVTFTVTSGSAALSSPSVNTDAFGQASTNVTAGAVAGSITITAATSGFSVSFTLTSRLPGPVNCSFANGASFQSNISPGAIATLTCSSGLATGVQGLVTAFNIVGSLPPSLAGISLSFGGAAAPIYYVFGTPGKEQVTFQVPFEVQPGTVSVTVNSAGGGTATLSTQVSLFAPGVFESVYNGQSYPVALRPDGSYVSPTNPAQRGESIRLYVTGLGQTIPGTGTNRSGANGQKVAAPMIVGLNNGGVPLTSAEYVDGLIGVYVLTLEIPASTQTGPRQGVGVIVYDSANNPYFAQSTFIPIQ